MQYRLTTREGVTKMSNWEKITVWVVKVEGQFKTQVDTYEQAVKYAKKYEGKEIEIKQSEAERLLIGSIW
jgi:hypothetical protein